MGLLYLYCRYHVSSAAMMKSKMCRLCLQFPKIRHEFQNDPPAQHDCANQFSLAKGRLANVQLL